MNRKLIVQQHFEEVARLSAHRISCIGQNYCVIMPCVAFLGSMTWIREPTQLVSAPRNHALMVKTRGEEAPEQDWYQNGEADEDSCRSSA